MMSEYFEVITNASTGEVTTRPFTAEEIAALEAAARPTKEQQQANRAAAYTAEADPIFFQYQRGEATEQDWLDKIEEIRARYPYLQE
jgi:uncharacterized protein involved in type VI secretion and phage assembly